MTTEQQIKELTESVEFWKSCVDDLTDRINSDIAVKQDLRRQIAELREKLNEVSRPA